MSREIGQQICIHAHPGKDPDQTFDSFRIVTGVLKRLPGALQKHAVLRIHDFGFLGIDPEEPCIEMVGLF